MKISRIVFLAMWIFSSPSFAVDIDFKGIKLGADFEQFISTFPDFPCSGHEKIGCELSHMDTTQSQVPIEYMKYAGIEVEMIKIDFVKRKLGQIIIFTKHQDFKNIVDALIEKFGKPKSTKLETLSTGFGQKIQNRKYRWFSGTSTLEATEYFSDINSSMIMYVSDEYLKQSASEAKILAKERAKKL